MERAELDLLDARRRLGEIDDAELHRARIVLLEREAERTRLRVDAGMVATIEADRARLAVVRERFLAGEAVAYAQEREAFLRALAERGARLSAAGFTTEAAVREERESAEAEFPP